MVEIKKLRAEKLLTSEASEEVKNCYIEALDLPDDVVRKLKEVGVFFAGLKPKQRYVTINDLLKDGRIGIMSVLSKSSMRYMDVEALIHQIEQKLAKIGLKFKDSDFTVLDVDISELDVNRKTKEFLERLPKNIKTLCDLSIQNKKRLHARIINDDFTIIQGIEKAMEKYGVKFIESSYKLNKNQFFPRHKLFERNNRLKYIRQDVEDERERRLKPQIVINEIKPQIVINEIKTENVIKEEPKKVDKKEYIKIATDLNEIGLSDYNIQLLQERLGVYSVEDLLTKTRAQVFKALNRNLSAREKINEYLKEQGLELVKNGVGAPKKILSIDALKNMSEEDKEMFKYHSIDDINIGLKTQEKLKSMDINVIADFRKITKRQLSKLSSYQPFVERITELMSALDIQFKPSGKNTVVFKVKEQDFVVSQEDKEEIMNKPLRDLGFGRIAVEYINENLKVDSLAGIMKFNRTEVRRAVNNNVMFMRKLNALVKKLGLKWINVYRKPQKQTLNKLQTILEQVKQEEPKKINDEDISELE